MQEALQCYDLSRRHLHFCLQVTILTSKRTDKAERSNEKLSALQYPVHTMMA